MRTKNIKGEETKRIIDYKIAIRQWLLFGGLSIILIGCSASITSTKFNILNKKNTIANCSIKIDAKYIVEHILTTDINIFNNSNTAVLLDISKIYASNVHRLQLDQLPAWYVGMSGAIWLGQLDNSDFYIKAVEYSALYSCEIPSGKSASGKLHWKVDIDELPLEMTIYLDDGYFTSIITPIEN